MRVTFLGTSDGHTSATRGHSGILLQTPESSLLLDCGYNVPRYLLSHKLNPDVPEAVWISHLHNDHIGQFGMLIQSLWLRARSAPLHIFAPAATIPFLRDSLEKCLLFSELLGFSLEWHPVRPGRAVKIGVFQLDAVPTRHLANLASFFKKKYPRTSFDCYGVAVTYRKQRYVYSADIEKPQDLRPAFKQPVHALFCELSHFPERELFKELAAHSVRNLLLTHYPDHLQNKEAFLKALAREEKYRGKVVLMRDEKTVSL